MNKLQGSATLILENGYIVAGEANLKSLAPAGSGYLGTFRSDADFKFSAGDIVTTMIVNGLKFRVAIARTDVDGVASIEANHCV